MKILNRNNNTKIIFFFLLILISFYRSPYIFFNGRFIGEEANHHFLFALNNNFFTNLFYYIEVAGYYNFIWNGKNDLGKRVSSGVYLYHAIVRDSKGSVVLNKTRKMILLK